MSKNSKEFKGYPENDYEWTEENWENMVSFLLEQGLVSWKEIAALILGQLNPSQVGTSIASNKSFQKHYPPRQMWKYTREWFFRQSGKCADCGTRLDLQADHIIPRETKGEEADYLDNLTLRCRRCNVTRRPSHQNGGLTFLTAESALMWLLFVKRPSTYEEFERLCRDYGLTMANIRFEEAWAMAKWLEREGLYAIAPGSKY